MASVLMAALFAPPVNFNVRWALRGAKVGVKIVYLDQNHWIELSKAAYQRDAQPETPSVLQALRTLRQSSCACFPLSLGHYMETLKHQDPKRRLRLANFMLGLSGGLTVAPPHVVLRHEMQVALERCFPGRVKVEPLQFLGAGLSYAADLDFDFNLEWPPEAESIPAKQRAALEKLLPVSCRPQPAEWRSADR